MYEWLRRKVFGKMPSPEKAIATGAEIGIGAAVVAATVGLGYLVVKSLALRPVKYYRCGNCNSIVYDSAMACPYCKAIFR